VRVVPTSRIAASRVSDVNSTSVLVRLKRQSVRLIVLWMVSVSVCAIKSVIVICVIRRRAFVMKSKVKSLANATSDTQVQLV
jgi:hypothetical protein